MQMLALAPSESFTALCALLLLQLHVRVLHTLPLVAPGDPERLQNNLALKKYIKGRQQGAKGLICKMCVGLVLFGGAQTGSLEAKPAIHCQ